jgi:hypothetical protein
MVKEREFSLPKSRPMSYFLQKVKPDAFEFQSGQKRRCKSFWQRKFSFLHHRASTAFFSNSKNVRCLFCDSSIIAAEQIQIFQPFVPHIFGVSMRSAGPQPIWP